MLRVTIVHREHEASLKSVFLTRKHTHTQTRAAPRYFGNPADPATRPRSRRQKRAAAQEHCVASSPYSTGVIGNWRLIFGTLPKSHFVSISSSA